MQNPRTYGTPPFTVAVIHGGPGAGGEMAPVARALAGRWGVLEPIQTAHTLDGQVDELRAHLEAHAALPATLIGYSWGAWLSLMTAAHHPALVKKLILVSCGALEQRYVAQLHDNRLNRLDEAEQAAFRAALIALDDLSAVDRDASLARLGALAARADNVDLLPDETQPGDVVALRGEVYQGIWPAAAEMRRCGALLDLVARVRCPVVAIHGAQDPSPAAGVREPLAACLADFRFVLLGRCGHTPWRERQARDAFYRALAAELEPADDETESTGG